MTLRIDVTWGGDIEDAMLDALDEDTPPEWQDDGDDSGASYDGSVGGSVNNGSSYNNTAPVSRTQSYKDSIHDNPTTAAFKYSGGAGLGNAIKDAAVMGVDVVVYGETHRNMAESLNGLLDAVISAGKGKISAVTLELPLEFNPVISMIQSGELTKAQFIGPAKTAKEKVDAAALYDFITGAGKFGVQVVAADAGDKTAYTKENLTRDDMSKRLNDQATYNFLKASGLIDPNKTIVVHQGISHITNGAGTGVKGVDDLLERDGYSTLTIASYKNAADAVASGKADNVQLGLDAPDVTIVGRTATIGKTTAETAETAGRGGSSQDSNDPSFIFVPIIANIVTTYVKKTSVTGGAGDNLFVDSGYVTKFSGGDGNDSVSYQTATRGLTANLLNSAQNSEAAKGDKYNSIENLYGSNYNDVLAGDTASNRLFGGSGNDKLYGHDNHDYLFGGFGKDELYGGNGNDSLYGDAGKDKLYGGVGHDALYGGSDNDVLYGEAGNDRLIGAHGADILQGGAGDDYLDGGTGDDRLAGGAGNDILKGGVGKDYFVIGKNDGIDHIVDFGRGDQILLAAQNDTSLKSFRAVQSGDDVRITWGDTQLYIENVRVAEIASKKITYDIMGMDLYEGFELRLA